MRRPSRTRRGASWHFAANALQQDGAVRHQEGAHDAAAAAAFVEDDTAAAFVEEVTARAGTYAGRVAMVATSGNAVLARGNFFPIARGAIGKRIPLSPVRSA